MNTQLDINKVSPVAYRFAQGALAVCIVGNEASADSLYNLVRGTPRDKRDADRNLVLLNWVLSDFLPTILESVECEQEATELQSKSGTSLYTVADLLRSVIGVLDNKFPYSFEKYLLLEVFGGVVSTLASVRQTYFFALRTGNGVQQAVGALEGLGFSSDEVKKSAIRAFSLICK